jgi:putative transposase
VSFRFALDPTIEQAQAFLRCAGAARFAWNRALEGVKAGLEAREWERALGAAPWTEVAFSRFALISQFNAWKAGTAPDSPRNSDGTRGLAWRRDVPADVFETAMSDLAAALKNWADSRAGTRRGRRVGFPRFKKKKSIPSFRLRHPAQICVKGRAVRLPVLGWVRVHDDTRRLRRMLGKSRFRPLSATVSRRGGRWYVSIAGRACAFHSSRRTLDHRHLLPVGIDRGIRRQLVVADAAGNPVKEVKGARPLKAAEQRLRRANKVLARTKPGSSGHRCAVARLRQLHARVANLRRDQLHKATSELVTTRVRITIEDLHIQGFLSDRRLAKATTDQALGEVARQLAYKARWYGTELVVADRWFPSSKTCSSCGRLHQKLQRSDTMFVCPSHECTLVIDRDLNAAVNLARWPDCIASISRLTHATGPSPGGARRGETPVEDQALTHLDG